MLEMSAEKPIQSSNRGEAGRDLISNALCLQGALPLGRPSSGRGLYLSLVSMTPFCNQPRIFAYSQQGGSLESKVFAGVVAAESLF